MRAAVIALWSVLLCAGPVSPPTTTAPAASQRATRPAQEVLAEFAVLRGPLPILVPVRFDGREYSFLLDTGASHTVFDVSLKPKLGPVRKTVKAMGSSGKTRALELFDPPEATCGPVKLKSAGPVLCMDLKVFRHLTGEDMRGVLGVSALARHVVQLDFDKGKLRLLRPTTRRRPEWGHGLTLGIDRMGIPCKKVKIGEGKTIPVYFDTGMMGSGAMPKPLFEDAIRAHGLRTGEVFQAGAVRFQVDRCIRVPEFRIGKLAYKGLIFDEGPRFTLGLDFFSRHLVTFDFPNRRLHLRPGMDFRRVDEADMGGMVLLRRPEGTEVLAVRREGPAGKAGVKAGDLVVSVNGKAADEYSMFDLRQLLRSGDGKLVKVTVRRGEETRTVSLRLRRQI